MLNNDRLFIVQPHIEFFITFQIPDGSRFWYSYWTYIQNSLQAQGIKSTPPVNTNICIWYQVSMTRRCRHSIPEGPERDESVQRIHPWEVSLIFDA